MSSCCQVTPPMPKPLLATPFWAYLMGSWHAGGSGNIESVCPCSGPSGGTCLALLLPKVGNWNGWSGAINASLYSTSPLPPPTVNFTFDISCNSSQSRYELGVGNDLDCGGISGHLLNGGCDEAGMSMVSWAPTDCDCCGCFPGQAPSFELTLTKEFKPVPPWVRPVPCECCHGSGSGTGGPGTGGPGNGGPTCGKVTCGPVSGSKIRYATGQFVDTVTDLTGSGLGFPLAHTRSFDNRLTVSTNRGQGHNWFVKEWSWLQKVEIPGEFDRRVAVMGEASRVQWFRDAGGDAYVADFGGTDTLELDRTAEVFRHRTVDGTVTEFDWVSGMILRQTNAGGHTAEVTAWAASDTKVGAIETSAVIDGETVTEQLLYDWSQPYDQRLERVTLRRRTGEGDWENISRVSYS